MSLKSKLFSVLTLSIAVAGFAAVTSAQETPAAQNDTTVKQERAERRGMRGDKGEGFRGGHRGPEGMLRGLHDLNLTDAQKQQIHTIMESNKPDQASMDEMRTLMEAKRNGTITADQQAQLKTLHEQGREKMKSVHEQIMSVLTDDQRNQLKQKREEMKQRMQERRQQREPGDQPTTDKPAAVKPNN